MSDRPGSRGDRGGIGFVLRCEGSPEIFVSNDADGHLVDQSGRRYAGTFDGRQVVFRSADGLPCEGAWVLGSGEVTGISGGGDLSERFHFTFLDHGRGNQRLNARFRFEGKTEEAIAAFLGAGYCVSRWDNRFNKQHQAPAGGFLVHLRSRGHWLTGADSGHAILTMFPGERSSVSGEVHVGEHNPTTGMGIGFLLHLAETYAWWARR
ncbi:hypothetical protein SAMN05421819_2108 [Bryocella elongata]|uniref:Uncharacterized protein n=1 Tax=Bryocella elongata TaxID=863522 RepID=A0A1H5Y4Y2_9BACT|nr:hypothetical protein [Bryocella elongata]SEG18650.1 hypothetical protein SAMN05421819_2108 [Bryocella elongata]